MKSFIRLCLLIGVLGLTACAEVTAQPQALPTPSPQTPSPQTPSPTALPMRTATPTIPPSSTPAPSLTPTPTDAPVSVLPTTPVRLQIVSFTADAQVLPEGGRRVTFRWQTRGASRVTLTSGTMRRFAWLQVVEPAGEWVQDFGETHFRNPEMLLMAYDNQGGEVMQAVALDWPCAYDYFFAGAPVACPLGPALETEAAQQPFEHGWMLWLSQLYEGRETVNRVIYAFFEDGSYIRYADDWQEGDLASDPALTPPGDRMQPVRGFGKVWRDNPDVRQRLGWATWNEEGFRSVWQQQWQEAIPGVAYIRDARGATVRIYGWQSGGWEYYIPQ